MLIAYCFLSVSPLGLCVSEIGFYENCDVSTAGALVVVGWPGHIGNQVWLALCPNFDFFQAISNPEVTAQWEREQGCSHCVKVVAPGSSSSDY